MQFPRARFLGLAVLGLLAAGHVRGEDFHVESKVYNAGEKEPITQLTTLFYQGVVYDFLSDPAQARDPETTVFDPGRERFIVLDPQRKLCLELKLADVQGLLRQLRIEAAGSKDGLLNFLSNPQFKEKSDGDQVEFASAWMTYRMKTVPAKSAEIARQYGEFSHWHGQLNVMINPGTLPPFGRMAVSQMLEERQLLPTDVYMTIPSTGPRPKLSLRAEHRFQWTMLERDRRMIDETQRQMKMFKQVTLKEYNDRLRAEPAEVTSAPNNKSAKK